MIFSGRRVVGGTAGGLAIVSPTPFSFYGGVDPDTGIIIESGHPCYGKSIIGKVFVFPTGKGSTVGSYVIYRMMKQGKAPAAIINTQTEAIIATGCVIAGIPLIDKLNTDPLRTISDGMRLSVRANDGIVEILSPN